MKRLKFLKRLLIFIPIIAITSAIIFFLCTHMMDNKDSGITGEGVEFDEKFYPYFHFLSEDGQKLYRQVYANAKE